MHIDAEESPLRPHSPGKGQREECPADGRPSVREIIAALGPGLVVCLADSECGGLITASQTGARYGYSQLLLYFFLVPVLAMAQELACRLGVVTGKGLTELARERYGRLAGISTCTLCVVVSSCAIITELRGVAAVGQLWGVSSWLSCAAAGLLLVAVVSTGSYANVERVALLMGSCELMFIGTMLLSRPDPADMAAGLVDSSHLSDGPYLQLIAANFGTIVTPWMMFYQQSAIKAKDSSAGLGAAGGAGWFDRKRVFLARADTVVGTVVTQLIMSATLITFAATLWAHSPGRRGVDLAGLDVHEIVAPLGGFFGPFVARVMYSCGLLGASLLASLVVAMACAWSVQELSAVRAPPDPVISGLTSSEAAARATMRSPGFFIPFAGVVLLGCVVTWAGANLVTLNVAVQVLNAVTVPAVLLLQCALSMSDVLPAELRLRGAYGWLVRVTFLVCSLAAVYAAAHT